MMVTTSNLGDAFRRRASHHQLLLMMRSNRRFKIVEKVQFSIPQHAPLLQ